jgi:hypothetical protein
MLNRLKPKAKLDNPNSNSTSQQIQNIKDSYNIHSTDTIVVDGVNDSISNDGVIVNTVDGDDSNGDNPTTLMDTVTITDNIRSQFKEELETWKLRYRAEALKAIAEAKRAAYEQGR